MSILPFSFPDHIFPQVTEPFPGLPETPKEKIEKITSKYHELVKKFDDYEYAEFLKSQNQTDSSSPASNEQDSINENLIVTPVQSESSETNDNNDNSITLENSGDSQNKEALDQQSPDVIDMTSNTTDTINSKSTPVTLKNVDVTEIEHPVSEETLENINNTERLTAENPTLNKLSRSLTVKIQRAQSVHSNCNNVLSNDITANSVEPFDIDDLFRWARETVDFAESQIGLPSEIVVAAIEVILLVSESQQGLTSFKGAALYIVGVWTLFGQFRRKIDPKKAFDLFYSSARHGFARAFYRIGSEFEKVGDVANAIHFFNLGVQRNDSACLYRIAMCFMKGQLGYKINVETGRHFLRKASKLSDPDCPQSSYVLGLIQLGEIQDIAPPDPSIPTSVGIAAMERAAWLGYGPALLRMGMSWQGGEKGYDASIALRYFHLTSRQQQYLRYKGDNSAGLGGCAEAEISKWMLCGSEGVFEPNEEYAFYFAKLASELSNPTAEFAVGYFYEVGIYVEKDIKTALLWYEIASGNGSKEAEARLQELRLDRRNTITKQQHRRQLTIKGRGSIKSYKRQATEDTSETATQEEVYPESSSLSITKAPLQGQKRNMTEHFGLKNINPPIGLIPSIPDSLQERTRSTSFFTPSLPAWESTSREVSRSPARNNRAVENRRTPSPVILNEPSPYSSSPNLQQYNKSPATGLHNGSALDLSLQIEDTPTINSAATAPASSSPEKLTVAKKTRKKRFSLVGLFSKDEEKPRIDETDQEVDNTEQRVKSMILDAEPRSNSVSPQPVLHQQNNLEFPPTLGQQRSSMSPSPKPYGRLNPSPRPHSQNSGHTYTMGSAISSMSAATDHTSSTSIRSDSPFQRPKSKVTVIQAVPNSKGAKTFEEMGIPLKPSRQKEDCIIM